MVAGMHRSGTSAMTRVLSLLGAHLPKHLMKPHPDNPAGFWESQSVTDLNDEVLQALDSGWDDVFSFRPPAYLSNFDRHFLGRAEELLDKEFEGRDPIILKDPRLSVLATFWDRALRNAGYEPHYVVMVRNPLEVADSLRTRDSFPREKSFLLWTSYLIAVERDTRDHKRTFVSYDQLMTDWRDVRRRLEFEMEMPFPRDTAAAAIDVDRFLDPRLRHHRIDAQDLLSREDVPHDVKILYRIFAGACEGADVDSEAIDAIERKLAETEVLVGPLLADMRVRGRKLERDIADLSDAHAGARAQADDLAAQLSAEQAARHNEAEAAAQIAQRLEQELQQARSRLESTEAERDEALRNNEAHLEHIRSLQDAQVAISAEQARLSKELQKVSRFADALRHDLQEAQAKAASLEQERDAADAERARLSGELAAAADATDSLRRDLQEAQARTASVQAERDATQAKAASLQVERDALEAERARLFGELAAAADAANSLRHDLEKARSKAASLRHERDAAEAQLKDVQLASSAERKRLWEELHGATRAAEAARRDLQKAQARAASAEQQHNAVEAQLKALKSEVGSFEAEMEAAIRALEQRAERKAGLIQSDKDRLNAELTAERERAEGQQVRLDELQRQADHFRAVSVAAESRLVKFEERLEEVEAEFDRGIRAIQERAEEKIVAVESERDTLVAEVTQLQGSLDALRSSLSWRATKPIRRSVNWVRRRFK